MSNLKDIRRKGLAALTAIALAAALLAGCASGSSSNSNSGTGSSGNMVFTADRASEAEQFKGEIALTSSNANYSVSNQASPSDRDEGGGVLAGTAAANGAVIQGKIIYSANVSMQVEDLQDTATELRNAIHGSGGYILQFNDIRHDGEIGSNYKIKVPAEGFMSFIDRLAQIEHLRLEQSLSGKDVSEEYVDLESRLKAKQLVEFRLLGMMDKAVRADDLLQFSNQLAVVQEEIEQIKGRIRYLDSNVAYSTIDLRIYQRDQKLAALEDQEGQPFGARLSDTLAGSAKVVLEGLKLIAVVLTGALPVLAVLAVIGIPIYYIVKYRRKLAKGLTAGENSSNSE